MLYYYGVCIGHNIRYVCLYKIYFSTIQYIDTRIEFVVIPINAKANIKTY